VGVGEEAVALQRRRRRPRVHRERQPPGHLDRHLARSLARLLPGPGQAFSGERSDPIQGLDGRLTRPNLILS
jgi:hypothetical protein